MEADGAAGDPACDPYVCDGGAAACPAACIEDVDCTSSNYCDGTSACAAKKDSGATCAAGNECLSAFCTDGVCCGSACDTTCVACNLVGTEGTCANIALGDDLDDECAGGACNGTGACALDDGPECTSGTDCLSGNCIDGVCCDGVCDGTCEACNVADSLGTCAPVPAQQDPAGECALGACNGDGACELINGQGCTRGTDCLSGNCVDDVCCDSSCGDGASDDCQACSIDAGSTKDGSCEPLSADIECRSAVGDCDAAELCDGISGGCPVDIAADDGASCDDGDACTDNDTCQEGLCTAGDNTCGSGGSGATVAASSGADTSPPAQPADDGGCSIGAPTSSRAGAWLLLALALVAGRRRVRRRTEYPKA